MHMTIPAVAPARPRSPFERLVWGTAPEYCDECGTELRPRAALRYSGGRAYCSLAHAIDDQDR